MTRRNGPDEVSQNLVASGVNGANNLDAATGVARDDIPGTATLPPTVFGWELTNRTPIGTISRHIICSGQLFAQFFRSHPEELPEAQRRQLQAQEAVRRLILSVPGPELV